MPRTPGKVAQLACRQASHITSHAIRLLTYNYRHHRKLVVGKLTHDLGPPWGA